MKLALVGEWFSSNLGDGAIGAALAAFVQELGVEGRLVDLSARTAASAPSQAPRAGIAAGRLPAPVYRLRGAINWRMTGASKSRSYFDAQLDAVDGVLIGGGQLIADHFLNFPRRIRLLCEVMAERRLPFGFVSCGVGQLSRKARQMLKPGIGAARFVGLRDDLSRQRFAAQFPEFAAKIVHTPDAAAVQAGKRWGPGPGPSGVGVIAKSKVVKFVPELSDWSESRYESFWVEIARAVADEQGAVTVFSNGEPADHALAQAVANRLAAAGLSPELKLPMHLAELVTTIESCDYVVAARLHAVLLALRAGVPATGVEWDPKVRSVLSGFGQEQQCLRFPDDVAHRLPELRQSSDAASAETLRRTLEAGRDALRHNLVEFIEVMR